MDEQAKWYVVHTFSGYENKVATDLATIVENRHLQDQICEISVPTETVVEIKDNQRKEVERKIFPGYVLVKMIMSDENWFVVRNVRGCTGFVGPNGKPVPLTEKEIASLGVEKKEIIINYAVGDTVSITDVPLSSDLRDSLFVGGLTEAIRKYCFTCPFFDSPEWCSRHKDFADPLRFRCG